ncbi:monocarboxylate transporter 13-like [Amphibalanus amphitrite]|uniref:monocarboxylate transporter 13-like n=1 Tax=Amphibalanus amphitrite TaxID=1232801 RepID=UPI001C90D298|nr:monocarboxylate transporter 13-like [Amphibalanus amphitrite]
MERLKNWVAGMSSCAAASRSQASRELTDGKVRVSDPCQARCLAKDAEAHQTSPKPDGGYGWLIVFASFLAHVTIYGVSWSVGVFNIIFLEEFQQSKSTTAWVGSSLNALMYTSGIVSSALVRRHGCRRVLIAGGVLAAVGIALSALAHRLFVLYFTFSLLGGVGLGLAYIPAVVIVSEYFEQRRTIALGLAVSGVGLGGFVFPPVIRALMEVHSWRVVLLIIASIVFSCLTVCGALMRPHGPPDRTTVGYLAELRENIGIMKSVPFVTLCFNNLLYCFGLVIVYVHLGGLALSSGLFSKANSGLIFSIVGVSNLVGRVLHGVVCHFPRMTTILVYMISSVGSGLATVLMPISSSVTALAVCACVFGFCSSCLGALLPDIIIRLVGDHRLGTGYGLLLLFEGAGSMLGGPVAGMLFDYMLVYDYSFYLSGALLLAAGLVMVVPWRYTHSWRRAESLYRPAGSADTDSPQRRARRKDAEAGRQGPSADPSTSRHGPSAGPSTSREGPSHCQPSEHAEADQGV